jgi:excisionase family DNA binding protein
MDPLLSVEQAARQLGVSVWTVYRLARGGQLASVGLGRRRLFTAEDLEELIRSRRRPPAADRGAPQRPSES